MVNKQTNTHSLPLQPSSPSASVQRHRDRQKKETEKTQRRRDTDRERKRQTEGGKESDRLDGTEMERDNDR